MHITFKKKKNREGKKKRGKKRGKKREGKKERKKKRGDAAVVVVVIRVLLGKGKDGN